MVAHAQRCLICRKPLTRQTGRYKDYPWGRVWVCARDLVRIRVYQSLLEAGVLVPTDGYRAQLEAGLAPGVR